jgi:Cys-tRNA(Pro)/Cys-tRNA(Cys) deacylase
VSATATPATTAARRGGVRHALHEYVHDPAYELGYGLEAATALGLEPARVFKTLVAAVDGVPAGAVVACVPVTGTLDLKALAAAVGAKRAAMAEPRVAERLTGYVTGAISPLGQRRRLTTVLDASAGTFPTVFVSAGRRGLEIEIAPGDLAALTGATVAAVGRW